jgi:hypothetical protein
MPAEEVRITAGLRWLGLFSQEPVVPRAGNLLDTLCARLEKLMAYAPGERDLVMLQHKFVVERADGTEVRSLRCLPSVLVASLMGVSKSSRRHSRRTARRAGTLRWPSLWECLAALPRSWCSTAVISTPGVLVPYSKEICDPIREAVGKRRDWYGGAGVVGATGRIGFRASKK